ncbi:MAG: response regulator transcription factor [Colwellia sp.]|nr:response regulator transcription factor [Colwellia sp.]
MNKILIVEDDDHIREMVLYILQKENYSVSGVGSAEAALSHCNQKRPDLILLDIELPGINGYQFCERLLEVHRKNMPLIIMLTDQIDVSDIEKGLASYADDYIAKPFNPRLLVARIKANLRRLSGVSDLVSREGVSHFGVVIDVSSRQVTLNGELIPLQKMEFDILFLLMSSPNRVFSRDALISQSKGDNYYISDRAIDNQIYKLRKKLGEAGKHLETVSGVGYRFSDSSNL